APPRPLRLRLPHRSAVPRALRASLTHRLRPPPRPTLSPYTTLFRSSSTGQVSAPILRLAASQRPMFLINSRLGLFTAEPQGEVRSEEHTSELQSRFDVVCRPLLETKKLRLDDRPRASAAVTR